MLKKMTSLSGASFCVRLLLRPVNRKSAPIRPYIIYICHRQKTAHKSSIDFFFFWFPPREKKRKTYRRKEKERRIKRQVGGGYLPTHKTSRGPQTLTVSFHLRFSLSPSFSVGCCCVSYINIRQCTKK